MSGVQSWAISVCFTVIAASILQYISPNGAMERVMKLVLGAFVLYGIMMPIISLVPQISNGFDAYIDTEQPNQSVDLTDVYKRQPLKYAYPVDGLIFEYDNIRFGLMQGATDHHENNKIAYKWADETVTTKFREIELNTTRTGMVSLTALFDKVMIDSTEVSRASVHNYDIFQEFQFGEGDDITVYKANKIIPQIEENLTRSGTYQLPHICPCCDTVLEIRQPKDARFLFCPNATCPARRVQQFVYFVSKQAVNIAGMSAATIEKFVDKGWIKEFADIYKLDRHKEQIVSLEGFGEKSYQKLWNAIEKSSVVPLDRFLRCV